MSLRLLHFSDAHVGVEAYGHFDPATGLNSRLIDFTRTLDAVVDAAIAQDVDLVLFTGDAYRTRDPSPTQQREFAARIRRFSEASIPVFLLVGNHDRPNSYGRAHAVDIFRTLGVPHITVGAAPETVTVNTRRGPVQITALPWLPRSYALTRESIQKLSSEEAKGVMLEKAIAFLRQEAKSIDRDIPAVLAAHVAVEGATYSAGAAVLAGSELTVPRGEIASEAWDYIALGHIHKHQVATVVPPAVYAGSIERVDFGEQDDPKGYVLVELGTEETTWRFVELPARRFVTVKVDGRSGDATELTLAAIERSEVADAIVRVQVKVTDVKTRVDRAAVRQALRPAYAFAGLAMLVDERDEPGQVPVDSLPHLAPVDALKLYLEKVKPVPAERRDRLCDRARILLQEATAGALEVSG